MKTHTPSQPHLPERGSHLWQWVRLFLLAVILWPSPRLAAQSTPPYPVGIGAGSYANRVPDAVAQTDSYFGLPADQMTGPAGIYPRLHLDPSLRGKPLPTNHWWTDLLFANRSTLPDKATEYVLKQDPFGGSQWVYPSRLNPHSYGLELYYPQAWEPAKIDYGQINADYDYTHGVFDCGPVNGNPQSLQIQAARVQPVPDGDVLVEDFENGFNRWTITSYSGRNNPFLFGPAQSNWTGQSPVPNGYLGGGYVNSFLAGSGHGANEHQGMLSRDFVLEKRYVHLLVGGCYDPVNAVVRIRVGGNVVYSETGKNSATLDWREWDMAGYLGQTATVEIVDTTGGGWGFIMCDHIVQSDVKSADQDPAKRYGDLFIADGSAVTKWGDWNVDFKLTTSIGSQEIDVTMARGVPFTWTTWKGGLMPLILVPNGTTFLDVGNHPINTSGGSFVASAFSFVYQGRTFGVFLPDNTTVAVGDGYIEPVLSNNDAGNYMVVGYLPDTAHLAEFNNVAFARPTDTRITWDYQPANGFVATTWDIATTPLKGSNVNTIQGWLPHHYRTTKGLPAFSPYTYLTPRGVMKCATGNHFTVDFPFNGMVPILPAPQVTGDANAYQPDVMKAYLKAFKPGTMMGDTYWSGKALALCSQYMAWAKQVGDTADYERLKTALEVALTDWFTYTPGEEKNQQYGFFTTYPDWHAFIGFGASYGSQAFNDLHFHYGYFTTAAATLAMHDPAFVDKYKDMLTRIAKSYANYDRANPDEPFLRTFDVWEGHSNAGGTGDPNGENQESSSEAMQSWAGLFLLGGTTKDAQMTAAGAMGFAMEAAATNEYWEDLWQENFPSAYYKRAFAGQVYGGSYSYGTFFSGDPAWVYGIQFGPSNHWLNYLTRYNPDVVAAKYNAMWTERANWAAAQLQWSSTLCSPQRDGNGKILRDAGGNVLWMDYIKKGEWVTYNNVIYSPKANWAPGHPAPSQDLTNWNVEADCTRGEPDVLGDSPGHVVHAYQALFDADTAAAEFDHYLALSRPIVDLGSQAGSTYYLIHSIRQAGQQDYTTTTTSPLSSVYYNPKTGKYNYLVYNPATTQQNVTVYHNGAAVGTFPVPAQTLIDSHLDQTLTSLKLDESNKARTIQPGQQVQFTLTGYDQYKATYPLGAITWTVSGGGTVDASGLFTASTPAETVTVTASSGGLSADSYTFRVGPAPVLSGIAVTPGFTRVTVNSTLAFSAGGLDQYGDPFTLDTVTWTTGGSAGSVSSAGVFTATTVGTDFVTAASGSVSGSSLVVAHAAPANVALGKRATPSSNPNAGNDAQSITDGHSDTRWESTAQDGQYIYVNLVESYDLSGVSIEWENAYAAEYEVQSSTDGVNWTDAVDHTAAVPQIITLPPGLPNHYIDARPLNSLPCRYLRLKLNKRITDYGFSLWELQVYGYPNAASITPTNVKVTPGVASTSTGLKTRFYAFAFDANADGGVTAADWSVSGGGTVDATGLFTATTAGGPFTVTASAAGLTSTASMTVANPPSGSLTNVALHQAVTATSSENDGLAPIRAVDGDANSRWSSAEADGESITVDLGTSIPLAQVVLNWEAAYGKKYVVRGSNYGNVWSDLATQSNGTGGVETLPVTGSYRYVRMQGVQRGTAYGYSLYEFRVLSYNPPVRTNKVVPGGATGHAEQANTPANNAVDGDPTTRWSSLFADDESITVNLGSPQPVSQVVLNWENAYGKKYKIQGANSNDASTAWTDLATQNNGLGGIETFNVSGTYQFIRMQGVQRATAYGYSLWELQVY